MVYERVRFELEFRHPGGMVDLLGPRRLSDPRIFEIIVPVDLSIEARGFQIRESPELESREEGVWKKQSELHIPTERS